MPSLGDPVEHIITIPDKNFKRKHACSIDFGGSVLKLAYCLPDGNNLAIHCASFTNKDMKEALLYLKSKAHEALSHGGQLDMCGVGTYLQEELIKEILGVDCIKVQSEMEGFVLAFQRLAETTPLEDFVHPESEVVDQYAKKCLDDMAKTMSAVAKVGENMTTWELPNDDADAKDRSPANGAEDKETTKSNGHTKSNGSVDSNGHAESNGSVDSNGHAESNGSVDSNGVAEKKSSNPQSSYIDLEYPALLIMTGSAGCPLYIQKDGKYQTMDAHTLGGRFFLGAGSLLTGAKSFEELVSLAEKGHHENLNVSGKDLKGGSDKAGIYTHMPDEPIFFNFGHAVWKECSDFKREDLAAAILTTTAMYLAQTYQLWCVILDVKKVFFCGSFTSSNQHLRDELSKHFTIRNLVNPLCYTSSNQHLRDELSKQCTIRNLISPLGKKTQHYFLRSGAYLGCIGCMLMTLQRDPSETDSSEKDSTEKDEKDS